LEALGRSLKVESMEALYDSSGRVYAWLDEGGRILGLGGNHLAFIEGDSVYDWHGQHVGWWGNGHIRDNAGAVAVFSGDADNLGVVKPVKAVKPVQPVKAVAPVKPVKAVKPVRPVGSFPGHTICRSSDDFLSTSYHNELILDKVDAHFGAGVGFPVELFIFSFELAVVLDELVELGADPVGMAGRAPGFLPAVVDERLAMSLLLFCGERHMESLF